MIIMKKVCKTCDKEYENRASDYCSQECFEKLLENSDLDSISV